MNHLPGIAKGVFAMTIRSVALDFVGYNVVEQVKVYRPI